MGRWIALLAVALVTWLAFATGGFEHVPFEGPEEAGSVLPADLRETGTPTPEAVGLRGRPPAPTVDEGERGVLPEPVDLDAARARGDVHGRVVRRADETPIAGAHVQLVAYPWQRGGLLAAAHHHDAVPGAQTRTASDGTFALPARIGVQTSLRVHADGFGAVERRALVGGRRVRIALDAAATLEVLTKAPDGTILSGVHVELRPVDRARSSLRREATSDTDGLCRFEDLPADRFALLARHGPRGGAIWLRDGPYLEAGATLRFPLVLPAGRIVRGVVLDAETRRPIAGARVGMDWTFFKSVVTDDEGRFALGGWTDDLFDEIHVTADGYARGEASTSGRANVEIRLLRACGIRGRVVDARGRGVADALLGAIGTSDADGAPGGRLLSTLQARTGPDGAFAMAGLHPAMPHRLVVMHPGYGRHLTEFDPPAPGRVVDLGAIVLPPALALRGTVLDAEGRPVPGIGVTLEGGNDDAARLRAPDAAPIDHGYGIYEQAHTDERGRFAFGELAPGTYRLLAGRAPHAASTRVSLDARTPPLTLMLPDARRFSVRVLDPGDRPVREQYVGLELDGVEDLYEATDQDGEITFHVPRTIVRGTLRMYYRARPGEPPLLGPGPALVDLREGSHVVRLRRAGSIRGQLLDPDGAPIPYGMVRARRAGRTVGSQVTDAGGGFTLVTTPGSPVTLVFQGEVLPAGDSGRQVWTRRPLDARLDDVPVDGEVVTLHARTAAADRTLRLRVLDEAGVAIADVEVQVMPAPPDAPARILTATDGTASLPGLTEQPIRLLFLPPQARRETLAPRRIEEHTPGEASLTVTLPKPMPFVVTVVDADGAACAGARLEAHAQLPITPPSARCDEEGRVRLLLPPDLGRSLELRATWLDAEGEEHYGMLERVDTTPGAVRLRVR